MPIGPFSIASLGIRVVFSPNNIPPLMGKGALVGFLFFVSVLAGCGYHFSGAGEPPGNIHSIAVEMLENRTTEVGLEDTFTNAILDQFLQWKGLPVRSVAEADAVLGGRIWRIRNSTVAHISPEQTLETRVTVYLALTLKRRADGKILWRQKSLSYFEEYFETSNALLTAASRREALDKIARYLAEKTYQSIFESF
jgi:outer membrane lipopolysaccharide assembly protein LptE/RlpB